LNISRLSSRWLSGFASKKCSVNISFSKFKCNIVIVSYSVLV
jgi:hypothetical protein